MRNLVNTHERFGFEHQGIKRRSFRSRAPWLVLLILCCSQGVSAQSPNEQPTAAGGSSAAQPYIPLDANGNPLPYRPKDGDKLGYSKEESIRRLDPEVREFLDGILRIYKEPGLFANRRAMLASLGTKPEHREQLPHPVPRTSSTDRFRETVAPTGVFARPGWSATYEYDGRQEKEGQTTWRALLTISVPSTRECIESKAVEGYLDLYLLTNLDGKPHPIPASRWDRHGIFGYPVARPLSLMTPGIGLAFLKGCLAGISIGNSFNNRELNDGNILN